MESASSDPSAQAYSVRGADVEKLGQGTPEPQSLVTVYKQIKGAGKHQTELVGAALLFASPAIASTACGVSTE